MRNIDSFGFFLSKIARLTSDLGAVRAGVKMVLLPASNRKDTKDLPQEVHERLNITYVG